MADAPATPSLPPNLPGSKKVENPTTVLLLGFFTCGVYPLYWLWLRTKEMNEYLGKQVINPMFVFPGCLCFPFIYYVFWLYANNLPEMQKKAGVEVKDEKILHFILLLFVMPVGMYMIQQKLNELWAKTGAT